MRNSAKRISTRVRIAGLTAKVRRIRAREGTGSAAESPAFAELCAALAEPEVRALLLRALGDLVADPGDPGALRDRIWRVALDYGDDALWTLLMSQGVPAPAKYDRGVTSRLAVADPSLDPNDPRTVADALSMVTHRCAPVRAVARDFVEIHMSPTLAERLCVQVMEAPGDLPADVADWCMEKGFAPADPSAAAIFYLRLGWLDAYYAKDPDGALLTAAYRAASPLDKARLRAAMAGAGDLDLLKVLAGAHGSLRVLEPTDQAYLIEQLAARSEEARLWRHAVTWRLTDAVRAAQRIAGWQSPPGDREFLAALAAADPDELTEAIHGLRATAPVSALFGPAVADADHLTRRAATDAGYDATRVSFSPDGRSVVARSSRENRLVEVGLDRGFGDSTSWTPGRWPALGARPEVFLHLGGAVVVRAGGELLRLSGDATETLAAGLGTAVRIARHPRGFVADIGGGRLLVGSATPGSTVEEMRLPVTAGAPDRLTLMAADADLDVIAADLEGVAVLDAHTGAVLARWGKRTLPGRYALLGQDRLVSTHRIGDVHRVTSWVGDGETVSVARTADLGSERYDITAVRSAGQIVHFGAKSAVVRDAETLAAVPDRFLCYRPYGGAWFDDSRPPAWGADPTLGQFEFDPLDSTQRPRWSNLLGEWPSRVPSGASSADSLQAEASGRFAWVRSGSAHLFSPACNLAGDKAGRTLTDFGPSDRFLLQDARRTLVTGAPGAAVTVIDLLLAYLEWRHGNETALGTAMPVTGEDDIALGGG
ncbi:hypothetical protein [Cryptosporangium minutisporangium]|uniref:Uncharacterized protein n=1 Tax=Cryptosporangium minutisporangium TaxID=113569 RepID=A0ABP6SSD6_9ACTN